MGKKSRTKGAAYEREVAKRLAEMLGVDVSRGARSRAHDDLDRDMPPPAWLEVVPGCWVRGDDDHFPDVTKMVAAPAIGEGGGA